MIPLKLRPLKRDNESEVNFILSSWLRNMSPVICKSPTYRDSFYLEHGRQIRKILQTADIMMACNVDDDTQLFGYLVRAHNKAQFAFVKLPFRRFGILTELIKNLFPDSKEIIYTQKTKDIKFMPKQIKFIYDPTGFYADS